MAELNVERNPDRDDEMGEGSLAFTITGPINVGQLAEEAAKQNLNIGVATESTPDEMLSDGETAIWLMNVDEAKATQLLTSHVPAVEPVVEPEPQPLEAGSDAPGFHDLGEDLFKLSDNERMLLHNVLANDDPIVDGDRDKLIRILLRALFWTEVHP